MATARQDRVVPTFHAPDGTRLAYHLRGEGEPLVVLPGGPMRASAHLGDLGRLSAHPGSSCSICGAPVTPRCRRIPRRTAATGSSTTEALRAHLGPEHMEVLAHSADGSLGMLYAARHPARLARLVLVTAIPWALGLSATAEDRPAAALLREDEPWFEGAFPAFEAWLDGTGDFDPVLAPFFHGRWDEAAADAQLNDEAADRYGSESAYDPPATRAALARVTAPVLVLAGENDTGPRPALARRACDAFPNAEFAVQPGADHYPRLDDPPWFVRRVVAFRDGDRAPALPSAK